ncbi:MAG: hypothetical protein IKO94_01960 [Selenomonadaceae bacterium]|nr:hypothetical protein [Selenomonadaceae bacterium]
MIIYLAGKVGAEREVIPSRAEDISILESFYYADDLITSLIPFLKNFMLDSGAFTFFTQGVHTDWDEYIARYADYIKTNKVKLFFELDIDSLVGYGKVKEIRKRLERETGRQPIPVWHKSRGKEEFLRMCDEYDYVAIGGIVSREIKPPDYKYFPWFISEAHKRGAKIHGLGFTNLGGLRRYHFDSVDSSSWTTGNRYGAIYTFDGRNLNITRKPPGTRVKTRETARQNFSAWVEFGKYAETHL